MQRPQAEGELVAVARAGAGGGGGGRSGGGRPRRGGLRAGGGRGGQRRAADRAGVVPSVRPPRDAVAAEDVAAVHGQRAHAAAAGGRGGGGRGGRRGAEEAGEERRRGRRRVAGVAPAPSEDASSSSSSSFAAVVVVFSPLDGCEVLQADRARGARERRGGARCPLAAAAAPRRRLGRRLLPPQLLDRLARGPLLRALLRRGPRRGHHDREHDGEEEEGAPVKRGRFDARGRRAGEREADVDDDLLERSRKVSGPQKRFRGFEDRGGGPWRKLREGASAREDVRLYLFSFFFVCVVVGVGEKKLSFFPPRCRRRERKSKRKKRKTNLPVLPREHDDDAVVASCVPDPPEVHYPRRKLLRGVARGGRTRGREVEAAEGSECDLIPRVLSRARRRRKGLFRLRNVPQDPLDLVRGAPGEEGVRVAEPAGPSRGPVAGCRVGRGVRVVLARWSKGRRRRSRGRQCRRWRRKGEEMFRRRTFRRRRWILECC